ncbi:glycosyltransferase family 87 protein [Amycolatopsis cihanbeyliensis]|uniref:Putative membrane protein n=1 Tax=Amycolatopsis cihanbeyliensis TaxID=1128664 RepID=A0A542DL29_AMYCI|nr:glycosyltransferase 87 family protein [Amycolatopsis cihanbeyliensis]TQJ03800.1 putative membrane protein [Amycolatopsis cihanbeyliensis]
MSGRLGNAALAVLVLLCGCALALGFLNKDRCTGPFFDESGRSTPNYSERNFTDACYSDIQFLWIGRDIDRHTFPYVHGDLVDGRLVGGAVEYPVLTGMLIWAGAAFADTDAGFLLGSALLLAPFGLLTGWLLGRIAGWRALLWAIGPPLVLYAFHNWELPAVACGVGAFAVVLLGRGSLRSRGLWAAALLGLGFAVKVFPAFFVLPLALYVLTGGRTGARRWDFRGAAGVLGVAAGTAVAVNLPFALAGFDGWLASFRFQAERRVDATTNSVWYWAFRPEDGASFQSVVDVVSPLLVLVSFAVALAVGWQRYRREGGYPLLAVSAAMLCGFLLLHKVHSPQYTLWLLPMFVLVRVRWGWVLGYLVADLAMGIGIFRWYGELGGDGGHIYDGFAAQAVMIGVWGRAALLAGLFVAFLSSREWEEPGGPADLAHRHGAHPLSPTLPR